MSENCFKQDCENTKNCWNYITVHSVQLLSCVWLFATPRIAARPVSLSPTPGVDSNSLPSSRWCHPAISSSVVLFSSCPQSLPASESFPMSQLFTWGGQSIGVSALAPFLPKKSQGWSPSAWTWLDFLAVQGTLKSLLQHHSSKASILRRSAFFIVQLSHPYMTTGKTIALTRWTFVGKVISLLFHMLSRLVITFLPRSKRLLISWLQSPSAVILEPPKIKSDDKEGWAPKKRCFWIVVMDKTFESALDCKKVQPVNPKGNQPWIFIGRTDAEAEAPIFWPPDVNSLLVGKDPDAGKDWRQEEKGMTVNEMVGWHHWLNGHEFEQALGDGKGHRSLACYSPWCHKESDST